MKYILPIFLAFLLIAFAVSADTSTADVARIHVIANSDSEEDIDVKMKVSKALTQLLRDEKFDSLDSIELGLTEMLDEIIYESDAVLSDCGVSYTTDAEVGTRYFDKKSLGGSSFPEGEYLALTVTLGEGKGHNWWSVIFPDVSLEASLAFGEQGNASKTVIMGDGTVVRVRCAIYELYKYILTKL